MKPEPFTIAVPDAELADLRERLTRARWPDAIPCAWADGTDRDWLREACRYWAEGFDWRAQEAQLNGFDQFRMEIDGLSVHFVHQRSPEPDAAPLLLVHGWPGSFVEFRHLIGPLTDPVAHGGRAEDAFHVVCPSIPGYGFSQAPTSHAFNGRRVAETFAGLMAGLGYGRYFAQGGDWGSHVSTWLGALDPACAGLHLNLVFARRPRDVADPFAGVSDAERRRLEARNATMRDGLGYQEIQGTRPQTLGYGLHDSPVGLAAWILEKFHGWSDHDGDLTEAISLDDALTNVSLYWFTGTITSSMRLYHAHRKHPPDPPVPERVEVPTAVGIFPGELYLPPRAWVERQYAVHHWREHPRGGHFAALEVPELLLEDVRDAFRPLR
ncbi:MAG: epoxide hydrolase family protein [Pseudomonadales bacterium]|jgi:pimeloyl-ACP methyl ester carboxylesterase|nr:epoxide hydrolase family protein [Pseudomonadales bacterium]